MLQTHKPAPKPKQTDPLADGSTGATDGEFAADILDPLLSTQLGTPATKPGDPSKDPSAVEGDVSKKMTRTLFDWAVTDKEANESFAQLVALPDEKLKPVLTSLAKKGKLKTLLEEIPASTWRADTGSVIKLFRNAPADVLENHIKALMKVGLFDWVVSEADVSVVLDALAVLPQSARDAFVNDDNGYFFDRLMEAEGAEALIAEREKKEAAEAKAKADKAAADAKAEADQKNGTTPPPPPTADVTSNTGAEPKISKDGTKPDGTKDGASNKDAAAKQGTGFFQKVGAGFSVAGGLLSSGKVDLQDVQTLMDGDIMGAKVDNSGNNIVDLDADWGQGLITVNVPSVGIASVAMDGVTSGASKLENLVGKVKYATAANKDSFISLDLGLLDLGTTSVDLGDNHFDIQGLKVEGVKIKATSSPLTQKKPLDKGDGVKLLINQIGKSIGLSLPAIKSVLSKGYEKPETLSEHFGKEFGTDADLSLEVASIHLTEVKKNGEAMAQDIDATDLKVETLDTSILPGLIAQANKFEGRTDLTDAEANQKKALDAQIAAYPKKAKTFDELSARAKSGKLSRKEQNDLIELRNDLMVGALHLSLGKMTTGKVNVDGSGADAANVEGLDVTVTGGAFEDLRHKKSDREKLDHLIGAKHKNAELLGNKAAPAMKIDGTAKELDVRGGKYADADMGTTKLSVGASNLGFGYDMGSGDLSATAEAFKVNDVDFGTDGNKDYKRMETHLAEAKGKNLNFAMNTNTMAMNGSADDLAGDQLNMPGYTTQVGTFAAGHAGFSMNAAGDVHADGTDVTATGVKYQAPGAETSLDKVSAKTFGFDMNERKAGEHTTSTMTASGTDVHAEGVGYAPSKVTVGSADAKNVGFSMVDKDDGRGNSSSLMKIGGTGVAAKDVHYDVPGRETSVTSATSGTLDFGMAGTKKNDGSSTSDLSVKGTDLAVNGAAYKPAGVGVSGLTAADYALTMSDKTDTECNTTSTLDVQGSKVHANDITYGEKGGAGSAAVKKLDAQMASFAMAEDGGMTANAKGMKAAGITYGAGAGKLGLQTAGSSNVDFGMAANGNIDVDAKDLNATGLSYGVGTGTGTKVKGASGKNLAVRKRGDNTTVTASALSANGVRSNDANVDVDKANANGLSLTHGKNGTTIDAKTFGAKGVTYDDPTKDDDQATVGSVDGKGLALGLHGSTTTVGVDHVDAKDVAYGSMREGKTGAIVSSLSSDKIDVTKNTQGISGSVGSLTAGESWVQTDDRRTYAKSAGIQGVKAENVQTTNGFSGKVDVAGVNATDVRTRAGSQLSNVGTVNATGLFAEGTGDQVLAGAKTFDATGLKHKDDNGMGGSASSAGLTDLNIGLSGLASEGGVKLDGLSVGTASANNIEGNADIWKLLNTAPKDDADLTDEERAQKAADEAKDPGKFKADALAHASGRVTAMIPIDVDLGFLGSLKADASLSLIAKDGKVDLSTIKVEFTNTSYIGEKLTGIIEEINPSLSADGAGNLELYFEIPIDWFPDIPVWVNIWEKAPGVSGGWFDAKTLELKPFVEGLMTPKAGTCKAVKGAVPSAAKKDGLQKAAQAGAADPSKTSEQLRTAPTNGTTPTSSKTAQPAVNPKTGKTTTESVSETMESVTPYVNVRRAKVDISGLQMGDGAIGNDNAGATLYGSKQGANRIDGSFSGGKGGSIKSDKIRAKDVYAGDLTVGDVKTDGLNVTSQKVVDEKNTFNKKQNVGGSIKKVDASKISYGKALPARKGS